MLSCGIPEEFSCTQNPDPKAEGIFNTMGRASYSEPVLLWDKATGEVTSFTTRFSFAIKSSGGSQSRYAPGDGIAFFLSPYPSKMPPYDGGGYLGLFINRSTAATPVVVTVEFDTYPNVWDPSTDHIGIDVNSINSTAVEVLPYLSFGFRFTIFTGPGRNGRNSKFRKNFGKFRTKSTNQNLNFGPKNGRNLNEKWPKFEQIFKFSRTKVYHKNIFNCRVFMADEMQQKYRIITSTYHCRII
jgi:hypothetical protein